MDKVWVFRPPCNTKSCIHSDDCNITDFHIENGKCSGFETKLNYTDFITKISKEVIDYNRIEKGVNSACILEKINEIIVFVNELKKNQ